MAEGRSVIWDGFAKFSYLLTRLLVASDARMSSLLTAARPDRLRWDDRNPGHERRQQLLCTRRFQWSIADQDMKPDRGRNEFTDHIKIQIGWNFSALAGAVQNSQRHLAPARHELRTNDLRNSFVRLRLGNDAGQRKSRRGVPIQLERSLNQGPQIALDTSRVGRRNDLRGKLRVEIYID